MGIIPFVDQGQVDSLALVGIQGYRPVLESVHVPVGNRRVDWHFVKLREISRKCSRIVRRQG